MGSAQASGRRAVVIDAHNDTIVSHIRRDLLGLSGAAVSDRTRRGGTIARLRGPFGQAEQAVPVQINFPKMRAGGIDAAFYAVDVTIARQNWLTYALDGLGFLDEEVEQSQGNVVVAHSAREIVDASQASKLAVVMAVENSDVLEGSLNVLRMLHKLGVRSIGLTHNVRSLAADGNAEADCSGGLTSFGVRLVQEMNRLGMLVDVAHINEPGFFHVMDISRRPVIVSHANCRAVCEHPRNLTDIQLRALAQNGGSVGITFVPRFVDAEAPSLDRLVDHVDHAVQVAGLESVGLGSDFDGGGSLIEDAAAFPVIAEKLLQRGYGQQDVNAIMGENHLRVLRAVLGE